MQKCGLLGRKLGHSYSPQIHAMLGDYEYGLYEKEPEEVEGFLRSGALEGFNVTIPYKKTVCGLCHEVSDRAKALGSVNTVKVLRDPSGAVKLCGDNTDYAGFLALVKRAEEACGCSVSGQKCLVLGSGGAGVTAVAVLSDLGANVHVISRSGEESYENLEALHADAFLLVNATPVGMYPENGKAAVDLRIFQNLAAVLDIVYNPARTALMLQAERLGIPAFGGLTMLVVQAAESCRVWTGAEVSSETVERIEGAIDASLENVVLVGMPGCGKTTIAQLLAEKTGRKVFDLDEEIVKLAGRSIPEIFAQEGEDAFRAYETRAAKEFGKRSGCILSCGGGIVTRPENYEPLHQNGRIVWIQRDLSLLAREGRPISLSQNIKNIYVNRKAMYEQFADFSVENMGTPEACAEEICRLLGLHAVCS